METLTERKATGLAPETSTGGWLAYKAERAQGRIVTTVLSVAVEDAGGGVAHDRPLVLRLRIRADIGQARPTDHTSNAAALATAWMRSPREAFESIYAACGATQSEIDTYHLRREQDSQAISGLYR